MTEYTPEQVQDARRHIGALGRTSIIPDEARVPPYEDAHEQDWALENEALILLAALEAVEKERDDAKRLLRLQHVDTSTLRDSETTKEQ